MGTNRSFVTDGVHIEGSVHGDAVIDVTIETLYLLEETPSEALQKRMRRSFSIDGSTHGDADVSFTVENCVLLDEDQLVQLLDEDGNPKPIGNVISFDTV